MNDLCLCTSVLAHGGLYLSGGSEIFLLIVMSLFVFVPLLFRKVVRIPKGLFISSFISYVLVLVNMSFLSFDFKRIPLEAEFIFSTAVYPYICIVGFVGRLTEWRWNVNYEVVTYLVAFIIDTLVIFAIIRLFLYIRQLKKPQAKQAV